MALAGRSHAVAGPEVVTCGAGRGRTDSGGVFYIYSGMSVLSTSGAILLRTTDAGSGGASGELALTSGTASCGDSGRLNFETGTAASGTGGFVCCIVGQGRSGIGGGISVTAGITAAEEEDRRNSGGCVSVAAGAATRGGDGTIAAGDGASASGGSIDLRSAPHAAPQARFLWRRQRVLTEVSLVLQT